MYGQNLFSQLFVTLLVDLWNGWMALRAVVSQR